MENNWIDDKGRIRVKPRNYAMVVGDPLLINDLLLYDSWDVNMAVKLIVLGYNANLDIMLPELKECPPGSIGFDRYLGMVEVLNRAYGIANSSISAGVLTGHDSPSEWIAWARRKGYNVDHFSVKLAIQNLEKAVQETSNAACLQSYHEQLARLRHTQSVLSLDSVSADITSEQSEKQQHPTYFQPAQEEAILSAIRDLGYAPTTLPKPPAGKPGVKAEVRKKLKSHPLFKEKSTVFDKAWERLREFGDIADE